MNPRLAVAGLAHAYALKTVLDDIDLTLEAGRVMALVGPSGCGKTTLLHLCAGLVPVQRGLLENSFARPAVMFQQPRLLPWKTARDNIALGLKAAGVPSAERIRRSAAMARAVGLDDLALDQFPHALSGGMQSRVALARALVLAPDLLLMDEPFSALDIGLKGQLHRLLLDHQREHGLAVLMITHDLMEAVRLADTILVMAPEPGRIVYRVDLPTPASARDEAQTYQRTAELLQVPAVRQSFGLGPVPSAGGTAFPVRATEPAVHVADLPGERRVSTVKAKRASSC
ncbi:ABC transporter ATP-binding protein [Aromatoleum buckelii]|uniref:ATP-binding cassette domain-containing protein n=1 Tax=Aromatoleum buckelii TaxID=200254 RepID=A0ABX1N5T9_9RHOO|nr:ABC transporter ATP-binding protein [Aromatoleum buckelii]MCK0510949.1 ABC transporter ATP-binding protein [Aromatoleum buckelii]